MHPGDQHLPQNDKSGQPNPFQPQQTSITRLTAQEIATLQAKLDKQLGPEYISDRPGAGGSKVQYLEAWKCINLANEIFGFNGWSSSIQNIAVDYMDENKESGRVSLGLSVVIRVTLRDGVFHEDIGYGSIDNAKSKAAAFEKATSSNFHALKRALRNFGNVLGNCLYDKTYLREVSKIKAPPPRFDINELHRRPEFAPAVKPLPPPRVANVNLGNNPQAKAIDQKPASDDHLFQDQFDDNYFDDYDFEDRPMLVESPRLNEFDTNTLFFLKLKANRSSRLSTRSPPSFTLPAAQNNASSVYPLPEQGQRPPQNGSLAQQPVHKNSSPSAAQGNSPSLPPVMSKPPSDGALQPTSRSSIQQQATEQPPTQVQQPQAVFMRVARDGTSASPYNHKAGNFSPMTTGAGRVDYNKSTPVAKPTANSKIPLGNNPDAHNRMGQSAAGFNPPYRMVGCPPTGPQSPYRTALHGRANSGPPLAGVKRNHQGQPVTGVGTNRPGGSEMNGRTMNQGQWAQPDAKRQRD